MIGDQFAGPANSNGLKIGKANYGPVGSKGLSEESNKAAYNPIEFVADVDGSHAEEEAEVSNQNVLLRNQSKSS